MRIAVTITAPDQNATFNAHFGRAGGFAVFDTDSGDQHVLANPAVELGSGAGIRAAEFLVKQGVDTVISGSFGPKASTVLRAAGLRLYLASSGPVDDLITQLQNGDLTSAGEN